MVKAYVLIKTECGSTDEVLKEIHELSIVEEAHKVFGAFDIVAEVRARDMEAIVDNIIGRIRKIPGMVDTQSLLVVDAELDILSTTMAN